MTQPSTDIFERVTARSVVDRPWEVELAWSAPQQGDRLVQVYVDQRLAAVTSDPAVERVWLVIEPSRRRTIELLATPGADAGRERPWLLRSRQLQQRHAVSARVTRDESLPVGASLRWRIDGGENRDTPVWPGDAHRGGFGGLFGLGGFGFDTVTGLGLGRGELGRGPLGSDGRTLRIADRDAAAGSHTASLAAVDLAGNPLSPEVVDTQTIQRPPEAASGLRFENGVLTWQ